MEFRRTFDVSLVHSLLTAAEQEGATEEEIPLESDIYYLVAVHDDEPVGLFVFHPRAHPGTYQGHANVASPYWGQREIAEAAGRGAVAWMFEHANCRQVVARVPHEFPQVQDFARRIGMREVAADHTDRYYEITDGNT